MCGEEATDLSGPGGDLLSRVLRQSTIGAEAFDGRVRDGIGSYRLAESHQAGKRHLKQNGFSVGYRLLATASFSSMRTIKPSERLVPFS